MTFVSATRGDHLHSVRHGGPDKTAHGYRIIGWDINEDGTVTQVHVFDDNDDPTTIDQLETDVRSQGRRLEQVPFGVLNNCCNLNTRL